MPSLFRRGGWLLHNGLYHGIKRPQALLSCPGGGRIPPGHHNAARGGNSAASQVARPTTEKWDAARKSRQSITSRIGEIESEQLRREHESPEYKEAARFAEGQRRMREKASARAAQVTSLTWENERRRRLRDAKGMGLFGKS